MTNQPTQPPRLEDLDTQELKLTQETFLLARAELAASRADPQRLDAARPDWPSPQR
jgi:hypothetical protein